MSTTQIHTSLKSLLILAAGMAAGCGDGLPQIYQPDLACNIVPQPADSTEGALERQFGRLANQCGYVDELTTIDAGPSAPGDAGSEELPTAACRLPGDLDSYFDLRRDALGDRRVEALFQSSNAVLSRLFTVDDLTSDRPLNQIFEAGVTLPDSRASSPFALEGIPIPRISAVSPVYASRWTCSSYMNAELAAAADVDFGYLSAASRANARLSLDSQTNMLVVVGTFESPIVAALNDNSGQGSDRASLRSRYLRLALWQAYRDGLPSEVYLLRQFDGAFIGTYNSTAEGGDYRVELEAGLALDVGYASAEVRSSLGLARSDGMYTNFLDFQTIVFTPSGATSILDTYSAPTGNWYRVPTPDEIALPLREATVDVLPVGTMTPLAPDHSHSIEIAGLPRALCSNPWVLQPVLPASAPLGGVYNSPFIVSGTGMYIPDAEFASGADPTALLDVPRCRFIVQGNPSSVANYNSGSVRTRYALELAGAPTDMSPLQFVVDVTIPLSNEPRQDRTGTVLAYSAEPVRDEASDGSVHYWWRNARVRFVDTVGQIDFSGSFGIRSGSLQIACGAGGTETLEPSGFIPLAIDRTTPRVSVADASVYFDFRTDDEYIEADYLVSTARACDVRFVMTLPLRAAPTDPVMQGDVEVVLRMRVPTRRL